MHMPYRSSEPTFGIETLALHTHSANVLAELKEDGAASSSGKGGGKGKDNEDTGQRRGVWSPKMAELIVAVKQEDWTAVQLLSQSYYEGSYMLQNLVDRHGP